MSAVPAFFDPLLLLPLASPFPPLLLRMSPNDAVGLASAAALKGLVAKLEKALDPAKGEGEEMCLVPAEKGDAPEAVEKAENVGWFVIGLLLVDEEDEGDRVSLDAPPAEAKEEKPEAEESLGPVEGEAERGADDGDAVDAKD